MKLRTATHTQTGAAIAEIWTDDGRQLVGTIYGSPTGVSKHIVNHPLLVAIDVHEPPAIHIDLSIGIPRQPDTNPRQRGPRDDQTAGYIGLIKRMGRGR